MVNINGKHFDSFDMNEIMKTMLTIVIYMQMFKQMDTMTFFTGVCINTYLSLFIKQLQNALAST